MTSRQIAGLLVTLCVFLSCWGPIDSPNDVDTFLSSVPKYSADRRTIFPADTQGGGYYVEMPLSGAGRGGFCVAVMNNPLLIQLCPNGTASANTVTRAGVTVVTGQLKQSNP